MKKYIFILLGLIVFVGGFLRMYRISTNPPGLYLDEISIGLNAYDILTTGRDQFGVAHPFLFQSLGDWKVPGYIYITAASMALFGKNEYAIRFPSALFGTLTILVVFLLVRELLVADSVFKKHRDSISLVAAGILAVMPWHIHFSRGGFEVVVALFFYLFGIYFALLFWRKKQLRYVTVVTLLFLAAMYTYVAYRLVIPITALIFLAIGIKNKATRKGTLLATALFAVGMLPLLIASFTATGQSRFLQISAFAENPYSQEIVKILGDITIFLRNFLSYFSVTFLFRFGDQINRHQVNDLGILYLWQLPLIIAGIYGLIKSGNKLLQWLLILILCVGASVASVARPSPHTLRFLMGSVPYAVLTALGAYQLFVQKSKWVRYFLVVVAAFAIVETGYYFLYYWENYPKEALIDWGGACKETALAIKKESKEYKHIVLDKNVGCLSEYFLFYIPEVSMTKVDPSWRKPTAWGNEPVLYVRPFYGNSHPDRLLQNIYLPDINHDIFTQLVEL